MTATAEKRDKIHRLVRLLPAVVLSLIVLAYIYSLAMKFPLNDPDIWWHLKTGSHIIETGKLPDSDPFNYTTPEPLTTNQIRGLRSQWLGQVIFATADRTWGLQGVFHLRNLLVAAPAFVLFFWLLARGMPVLAVICTISLPALLFSLQVFYSFERPQGFSFLFSLLVVLLLERLRSHTAKQDEFKFDFSMVLLPAFMALWSNVHAGFIVGNVIIGIYLVGELVMVGWRKFRRKKNAAGVRSHFFVICLLALAASGLNPNGFHVFHSYLFGLLSQFTRDISQTVSGSARSGWVEQVVLEFKPLTYFYKVLRYEWLLFYWLFSGLLFMLLAIKYWIRRQIDLAELFVVAFITFFANYYARGLMFSLAILPVYMGKTVLDFRSYDFWRGKLFKVIVVALLILSIGFAADSYPGNAKIMLKPTMTKYYVSPWYPIGLCNFLLESNIQGPMYNFYTWGGYLLWRLYPKYEVFVDGRALDNMITSTADSILKTFPGWQGQLEAFNFNFIVIPVIFRESGHIIPLAPTLVNEPQWELVYLRNNSALFVRNVPKNREIIAKYRMDKRRIFQEIIMVENIMLMGMPNNPTLHIAKADALFMLGKYAEAKAIYQRFPREGAKGLEELRKRGF